MSQTNPVTAANVDLSNCDREQIQFSNAIQPHAALVVFDPVSRVIVQTSANAPLLLGEDRTALESEASEALDRLLASELTGVAVHLGESRLNNHEFDLFGYNQEHWLALEWENRTGGAGWGAEDSRTPQSSVLQSRLSILSSQLERAPNLGALLDTAATSIRTLTGFDRVMIYRFAADGSGEVMAESVDDEFEPYLGLHYPASDIPQPARRLFSMSWLRYLPDTKYEPVPLLPETNPLVNGRTDLSLIASRSVSVMYTQYLRNMGVQATMVITLLRQGRLWGLVSCMHHRAPRRLPYAVRSICELLGHTVSLMIASKEDAEFYESQQRSQEVKEQLITRLVAHGGGELAPGEMAPVLKRFLDCTGVALISRSGIATAGTAPGEADIDGLCEWLAAQDEPVFATNSLPSVYPEAAAFQQIASGLLSIRVSHTRPEFVMWFRPELIETVKWAGDPAKPVEILEEGGEARLSPRSSFAIWRQEVHGKSEPWRDFEVALATRLRHDLLDIVAAMTGKLERANLELQQRNDEIDLFASVASHDLKTPLRAIHTNAELLSRSLGAKGGEAEQKRLATILRLARRMDELIDSLLRLSRSGRIELSRERVDLSALVNEVLDVMRLEHPNFRFHSVTPLPVMDVDRTLVREVFQNLVTNAIKYTNTDKPEVLIGHLDTDDVPVIYVRDNGIGIDPEHHQRIFKLFHRLHGKDEFGGGSGAGLAIVKATIQRHGGRIWVESSLGKGSTFYFTLRGDRENAAGRSGKRAK